MIKRSNVRSFRPPFDPSRARDKIREILQDGTVVWSNHSYVELAKDSMTTIDAVNVLRGGTVRQPEFEHGGWRYKVETQKMAVIVAFDSPTELCVVTAWRKANR